MEFNSEEELEEETTIKNLSFDTILDILSTGTLEQVIHFLSLDKDYRQLLQNEDFTRDLELRYRLPQPPSNVKFYVWYDQLDVIDKFRYLVMTHDIQSLKSFNNLKELIQENDLSYFVMFYTINDSELLDFLWPYFGYQIHKTDTEYLLYQLANIAAIGNYLATDRFIEEYNISSKIIKETIENIMTIGGQYNAIKHLLPYVSSDIIVEIIKDSVYYKNWDVLKILLNHTKLNKIEFDPEILLDEKAEGVYNEIYP